MGDPGVFRNLQFERRRWGFPQRLVPVLIVAVIFTVLWNLVPHGALYWLLLPLVVILTWASTFSWRQALAHLIVFLHRLEQY